MMIAELHPGLVISSNMGEGFSLIGRIGAGGFGEVWEALLDATHERIAVKVLDINYLASNDLELEAELRRRFLREGKRGIGLTHSNIVKTLFVGSFQGLEYICMELCHEGNLLDYLFSHHSDNRGKLEILCEVCQGLYYLHRRRIVHRDLKPENILFAGNKPKLADFGLAKWGDFMRSTTTSTLTSTGQIFGTPVYMSPEQKVGSKHVDHRTDLYTLGIIMYEMFTGSRTSSEEIMANEAKTIDYESDFPGIDAIFRKLVQWRASDRYQSARSVIVDIERYLHLVSRASKYKLEEILGWSERFEDFVTRRCGCCSEGPIVRNEYWEGDDWERRCLACGRLQEA